jgi:hypothetical protein
VIEHPASVFGVVVAGTLSAHSFPAIHQCPAGTLSVTIVLIVFAITAFPACVAERIFTVLPLAVFPEAPSAGVVTAIAAIRPPAPSTIAGRFHALHFIVFPL